MTRNEFNLLYAIKKNGILSYRKLQEIVGVSVGYISQTLRDFKENGYLTENGISDLGIEALKPYKVDNAIIMAAGIGSHFVPMTLEKPKGLYSVRNEVLIERQIEQLLEAGIEEIVLVLGYKKEAFFYLERKYSGIKIVINPEYNVKNNTHTLYLAQKYIRNSYICSSDDYFESNPFERYEFNSYYAGMLVDDRQKEWYMIPDDRGNITRIEKTGKAGYIMLGHAFWNAQFSEKMIELINLHHELETYDQDVWEQVLLENLKKLPPMEIREYPKDYIFEFDSLEELRKFDFYYVERSNVKILKNISRVLGCKESDIFGFEPIKEGLTNTSFVFVVKGKRYVYRHPGEGTEEIISRTHEKRSLELAKALGVDPTFIFMDEIEGWKISTYVDGIRTPDYSDFQDSKRVLSVLRNIHSKNITVDWEFLPWEEACKIEVILLSKKNGIADSEFGKLRDDVKKCYNKCYADGIKRCFCHCDTYSPNWMFTEKDTILIDWEYAGNADPGCDLGTYIMDSMWSIDEAIRFIKEYCGEKMTETQLFHYLAYTAIVSYYWYVWALYREACGAVMGESLYNWQVMAKRYSNYLVKKYNL